MAAQCSAPSARASAKRAQRRAKRAESLSGSMRQFVTPQVWKQVKHAAKQHGCRDRTRWTLQPLILIAAIMTWCAGETDADRFVLSRAFYVQIHAPKRQRPGKAFSGFGKAMLRLPMPAGASGGIGPGRPGWLPTQVSGKEVTLPPPPPLRTARESFPSCSSSLSNALRRTRLSHI